MTQRRVDAELGPEKVSESNNASAWRVTRKIGRKIGVGRGWRGMTGRTSAPRYAGTVRVSSLRPGEQGFGQNQRGYAKGVSGCEPGR
jgi:hypothetical protein